MTVFQTMASWLGKRGELNRDAPALTFAGRTQSYGALYNRVARAARLLRDCGIGPGDRIGYLGANHPDILVVLFAGSAVGAAFVPLNIRLSGSELAYIIEDSGLSAIFSDESNAPTVEAIRPSLDCAKYFSVDWVGDGWTDFASVIERISPISELYPARADEMAAIVYTSGTTGRPKGAILTHGNLWSNDLNWTFAYDIKSSDVMLTVAPLFHVSGLFVLTSTVLLAGGHVVLMPGFDAGAVIDAVEEFGVTATFGVPAMMLFLSQHERFGDANLASLRLFVAGGAPVSEPLLKRYAARGIPVNQCYGLSEVVSATTSLETANAAAKLGSAGRAMMMAEIRLIDDRGQPITRPDEKGEITVRGGNVSPGYWRNAEATAATVSPDGWLRTGDVGFLDSDGFLFVCDRVKDMIISGGENVYPAEVESVLFDHPAISNVAVVGRPDDTWGERVVAIATLHPGASLRLENLQEFCDGKLARYKIPRELHIRDELPLNGSGKVMRRQLREAIMDIEHG